MRWLDVLLGRTRPAPPRREQLFALSAAYVTLVTKLGYQAGDRAGIAFRPSTSSYFQEFEREVRGTLKLTEEEMGTKAEFSEDRFGFRWVVLQDEDFEDLVATVHQISIMLADHGFGEQLLAAVFASTSPRASRCTGYTSTRAALSAPSCLQAVTRRATTPRSCASKR